MESWAGATAVCEAVRCDAVSMVCVQQMWSDVIPRLSSLPPQQQQQQLLKTPAVYFWYTRVCKYMGC